jgi:hypothetical protein
MPDIKRFLIKSIPWMIAFASLMLFSCVIYLAVNSTSHTDGIAKELESLEKRHQEYAYFEGHKDAIEGDIRIEKQPNGRYKWLKSPWNDGDLPSFNPYKEDKP